MWNGGLCALVAIRALSPIRTPCGVRSSPRSFAAVRRASASEARLRRDLHRLVLLPHTGPARHYALKLGIDQREQLVLRSPVTFPCRPNERGYIAGILLDHY
jgi:hypothetical protein